MRKVFVVRHRELYLMTVFFEKNISDQIVQVKINHQSSDSR